jgi:hypothetical protein
MAHTEEQINSIIDKAMKKHQERGNAKLSDDARAEITTWWRNNQKIVDKHIADKWTEEDFANKLVDVVGRAQQFQSPGPAGTIGGGPMKAALAGWGPGSSDNYG